MQYSGHKANMKFSSHHEMRRVATPSEPKFRKCQKLIILTSHIFKVISQPPYSHYMDHVCYDFTNNFEKMPEIVAL